MGAEKKVVIARIQVVKGKEKEYLDLVAPLIASAKAEPGNLAYTLYQGTQDPSEFIVYEEYVSKEAFDAHCATPAFMAFVEKVKALLAKEIDIQVF